MEEDWGSRSLTDLPKSEAHQTHLHGDHTGSTWPQCFHALIYELFKWCVYFYPPDKHYIFPQISHQDLKEPAWSSNGKSLLQAHLLLPHHPLNAFPLGPFLGHLLSLPFPTTGLLITGLPRARISAGTCKSSWNLLCYLLPVSSYFIHSASESWLHVRYHYSLQFFHSLQDLSAHSYDMAPAGQCPSSELRDISTNKQHPLLRSTWVPSSKLINTKNANLSICFLKHTAKSMCSNCFLLLLPLW